MKTPPSSDPQWKSSKAAGLRSARHFPWTKGEDALLGKLTAREVARSQTGNSLEPLR
jgi:hypothetical protein